MMSFVYFSDFFIWKNLLTDMYLHQLTALLQFIVGNLATFLYYLEYT